MKYDVLIVSVRTMIWLCSGASHCGCYTCCLWVYVSQLSGATLSWRVSPLHLSTSCHCMLSMNIVKSCVHLWHGIGQW